MKTNDKAKRLEWQMTVVICAFAVFGVYLLGASTVVFAIVEMPPRGMEPSYESQMAFRHLFKVAMFGLIPIMGILCIATAVYLRCYRRQRDRLINIAAH